MKWHKTVDTPGGRGLLVVFESGESLTLAKGIDDRLHIVSSSDQVAFTLTASGGLMVAPKLKVKAEVRKARNGRA